MSGEADGVKDESPAVTEPSGDALGLPASEPWTPPGGSSLELPEPKALHDVDSVSLEDETDSESVMVGAGSSAGAARAAARRSGVRSGVTASKGVATRQRVETRVSRGGLVARVSRFLREVVAELRKVIWPARNQMITYTIVVIVFVSFMVALVAGLDVGFARAILAIFG